MTKKTKKTSSPKRKAPAKKSEIAQLQETIQALEARLADMTDCMGKSAAEFKATPDIKLTPPVPPLDASPGGQSAKPITVKDLKVGDYVTIPKDHPDVSIRGKSGNISFISHLSGLVAVQCMRHGVSVYVDAKCLIPLRNNPLPQPLGEKLSDDSSIESVETPAAAASTFKEGDLVRFKLGEWNDLIGKVEHVNQHSVAVKVIGDLRGFRTMTPDAIELLPHDVDPLDGSRLTPSPSTDLITRDELLMILAEMLSAGDSRIDDRQSGGAYMLKKAILAMHEVVDRKRLQ